MSCVLSPPTTEDTTASPAFQGTIAGLSQALEEDGFCFFRNFFDSAIVEQAYREIEVLYQQDLQERAQNSISEALYHGASCHSVLTAPSHLMLNIYAKSPTFDQMFEAFLTHPVSAGVLENLIGKHIKLRGYNVRRMTGQYDPSPQPGDASALPHEWHRDSKGEICIAFLLTDVPGPGESATALLPGAHRFSYCPRWNNLFSRHAYKGLKFFLLHNLFNKRLAKQVFARATGAYGQRGDVYIFINDTWHGRQPNLNGREAMIVMVGAFATDFPFPDKIDPPSDDILSKLRPHLRQAAAQAWPPNQDKQTIIHRMLAQRQPTRFLDPFYCARLERQTVESFSRCLNVIYGSLTMGVSKIKSLKRSLTKRPLKKHRKKKC
jgi:putative 2OG-Fe(II) oxygenase